ncbi:MAG: gamma-glutamylcyclotransferase [Salinarimonadaceae bacterium]|nr:MAG: gamma-glutamylcyclotransferase [Salinarimonadaceae bacterium]
MSSGLEREFWVFGYGSLMWRPGFAYRERMAAEIAGWRRALCVYSHVHRGTPDRPGLVFGLDRGGSCRGVAYCVATENSRDVLDYLRAREQATMVYLEAQVDVRLDDGRLVTALTYVVDDNHPQYAGALPREELLRLVRQGVGISGANPEYVIETARHLKEIGVEDAVLAELARALAAEAQAGD